MLMKIQGVVAREIRGLYGWLSSCGKLIRPICVALFVSGMLYEATRS
jgi:hypothetical protein